MMTLHQSDRVHLHLQKGDLRRHPEAVAKREHEVSPLHHHRRSVVYGVHIPRPSSASSPTMSRAASPPQAAPPRRKQVCRVRFERGKTPVPEGESGTTTQKKPVKPPAEKAKRQTAATRKDIKAKAEQRPTIETETQATSSTATYVKELLVSTPKIDAMTEIAKHAVANLKKREVGVKFKEPPAKPEKGKQPPPKRHQHPLPSKGKSAYVGKGKATAPGKKPLEVITISA